MPAFASANLLPVADSTSATVAPFLSAGLTCSSSGGHWSPAFAPLVPTPLVETSCPRLLLSAGQSPVMRLLSRPSHVAASTVSWALSVPAFQSLPSQDQQVLLEESLLELLVLTALQLRGSVSHESLEAQVKQFLHPSDHLKLDELMKYVSSLTPPLNHLELTSLKALLLFRPGLSVRRSLLPPLLTSLPLLLRRNRVQWPDRRPSGVHGSGSCSAAFVRANCWLLQRLIDSSSIRSTAPLAFNHQTIESQQFPSYSCRFSGLLPSSLTS